MTVAEAWRALEDETAWQETLRVMTVRVQKLTEAGHPQGLLALPPAIQRLRELTLRVRKLTQPAPVALAAPGAQGTNAGAPPPTIVVNVPKQPAPIVYVNVPPQPAPVVNVDVTTPRRRKVVERDGRGQIKAVHEVDED